MNLLNILVFSTAVDDFVQRIDISNLKKHQPSENEYWGFANCIPRTIILHEVVDENILIELLKLYEKEKEKGEPSQAEQYWL